MKAANDEYFFKCGECEQETSLEEVEMYSYSSYFGRLPTGDFKQMTTCCDSFDWQLTSFNDEYEQDQQQN